MPEREKEKEREREREDEEESYDDIVTAARTFIWFYHSCSY